MSGALADGSSLAEMESRSELNEELAQVEVKLSMNDLRVRACALAMSRNPLMNASWDGDAIVLHGRVHIGVAVALPEERGGGFREAEEHGGSVLGHMGTPC